ncbi:unnamed protein product [Protopolystoma xenopodis]|uniref:Uncharacterized protein n=1 Tax=Protopolystoma xenopodis TaxID=117903 RepID=A0A448XS07_9PLAT|nr:unnamed protein product [Protopolystoma xenopodis]
MQCGQTGLKWFARNLRECKSGCIIVPDRRESGSQFHSPLSYLTCRLHMRSLFLFLSLSPSNTLIFTQAHAHRHTNTPEEEGS